MAFGSPRREGRSSAACFADVASCAFTLSVRTSDVIQVCGRGSARKDMNAQSTGYAQVAAKAAFDYNLEDANPVQALVVLGGHGSNNGRHRRNCVIDLPIAKQNHPGQF